MHYGATRRRRRATVMELDPVVRELDPDTYRVWFSADTAIRACLAARGAGTGSAP